MSKSGNLAQLSPILDSRDPPTIYYAEDGPYLPRILIFYWPVQAVGSLSSTSRVRTTILSAAGFRSYGAFSVAPSSSYYSAVHKLPDDKQRDDVCRAMAFALCRYFSEVPTEVKNAITEENLKEGPGLKWGQTHAAQVACKMSRVINTEEVVDALRPFHKERPTTPLTSPPQTRPLASIRKTRPSYLPAEPAQSNSAFARFTTPSKRIPSNGNRRSPSASATKKAIDAQHKQTTEQLEGLRYKMCEFVDTEDRYIIRVQELIDLVVSQGRTAKSISSKFTSSNSQKTVNAMLQFPSLLDQIKDLNLAFLDDIESVLQGTEEQAISYIEQSPAQPSTAAPQPKDPLGVYAFAKVLINHFPKFPVPYRRYLDLHSQISSNLDQFFRDDAHSVQIAPSLLMEPAQRISRYGLYIDTMIPQIPPTSTIAIRTLEKARKIIAEICEMEPAASTILDSLRIEHEAKKRSLSPTKLISGLTRANTIREAPAKNTTSFHITGSLRERDAPRFMPSLSRSFSKKNRSRPGLAGILSEQNPEQAQNRSPTNTNDENFRPKSSGNGSLYNALSFGRKHRPEPTHSHSASSLSVSSRPNSKGQPLDDVAEHTATQSFTEDSAVDVTGQGQLESDRAWPRDRSSSGNIEHYKAQVMRLEQENYKLLAENAELKRLVRECRCGGVRR
ncbi:hypothetical protein LTR70_001142 [Exophiala xenobiotica]|uniref:DH domain-containing protein n=1 Tax=Lithohypha guttulata TaxID=1690604 RepID=A0ABR0KNP8_9EURO|nr:hypothetical protein LTR24_000669 [Lithohypha guttulata]KAK5328988.1 hypothetical protein LTR70_001142 [Exophiala xenobiotica]